MTIFSRIIAGEIPCYKIAESDKFFAFLDINPLALGHTLVVPKQEVDYIFDMNDADLGEMTIFAKQVAAAIKALKYLMHTSTSYLCNPKPICTSAVKS